MISLLIVSAATLADPEIVITASRLPVEESESAASAATIDQRRIERLGEPLVPALIRLTPSAAVENGGPAGSLAQVRIRGAEANHTLLFIDGIRANDPAAGDIPRFELLNADIVSRIEVVRGPQSALWGADAIGGVVAVNGLDPQGSGHGGAVESGSLGFRRASASAALDSDRFSLAGALGWQRAKGIDSFDGNGDRDGYRNLSGRLRAKLDVTPVVSIGAAAFALYGKSEFDGYDPFTFRRGDTLDATRNRLAAGRLWLTAGNPDGLGATLGSSFLASSNRNMLSGSEINRTRGTRWALAGQVHDNFSTGRARHTLVLAADLDRESFRARDAVYFGASDQDRSRTHQAITGEWRVELAGAVADIALRHDMFSAFEDATTLRASALARLGSGFSVTAAYAEGIAQPSFFDLYGFFPGSFVGNESLRPERSRGVEAALRYDRGALDAALTVYRQNLRDEIVDVFDPSTFLSSTVNRDGSSRRRGVEAELGWALGDRARISANYAFLDAHDPGASAARPLREVRRPKHSGSIAADGAAGPISYGASLTYIGARSDTNFDVFPAQPVRLRPYVLAGLRLAYQARSGIELFARASNLFDSRYQDVFGYRTEGRALFAGIRLAGRRSSR